MSRPRILILYGTSYGQTAKIASKIGEVLSASGCQVTLANAAEIPATIQPGAWDGVIVGASLIARGLQPAVVRIVQANRDLLARLPSAFFMVSASAGSARPEGRAAAEEILQAFLRKHEWHPLQAASMAGAVNYTRYNPFLRWYMKRASKMNGGATDTSRDHEYTDWQQVRAFAESFAATVTSLAPVTAPTEPAGQAG